MYCRALVCDFDGTGATAGHLAPEVGAALAAARARGIVAILATGRVLEDLQAAGVDLAVFDAVVAENGAIVWLPGQRRTVQLGEPPPESFLGELRARGIPLHAGAVIVGASDRHAAAVLEMIRKNGVDAQLIFNRSAMMLLPSGVNKAVGVRCALAELGRSERSMIAFGDAENDHPLLAAAELGVAARGSVPSVAASADVQLSRPGPEGVAHYVERIVESDGIVPTPPRRHIVLGHDADGRPAILPASGTDVMIVGDPRVGKSWVAGLVAERLIDERYRLCLIDPEGDHTVLARRPGILGLGSTLALPAPADVPELLREEPLSVILDLSSLAQQAKLDYVHALLQKLEATRALTGIPHWIMVDEAHYFFHTAAPPHAGLGSRTGNYAFVTYRPSLVAPAVTDGVRAWVLMPSEVDEERYFVGTLLQARGPRDLVATDALAAVRRPNAGLLVETEGGPRWTVFAPYDRVSPHVRHRRKYADARLPDDKAFYFRHTGGAPVVAHNLVEFCSALESVPDESLRQHLLGGDFSRWAAGVLGDAELASGLHKIELTTALGAAPRRSELVRHVQDRYVIAPEAAS